MLVTTLNSIHAYRQGGPWWLKYLDKLSKHRPDEDPLSIRQIYELFGLDDALYDLRSINRSHDSAARLLMCDLVQPAMLYTDDTEVHKCVYAARLYANGRISSAELAKACMMAIASSYDRQGPAESSHAACAAAETATTEALCAIWSAASIARYASARASLAGAVKSDKESHLKLYPDDYREFYKKGLEKAMREQEKIFLKWLTEMDNQNP